MEKKRIEVNWKRGEDYRKYEEEIRERKRRIYTVNKRKEDEEYGKLVRENIQKRLIEEKKENQKIEYIKINGRRKRVELEKQRRKKEERKRQEEKERIKREEESRGKNDIHQLNIEENKVNKL